MVEFFLCKILIDEIRKSPSVLLTSAILKEVDAQEEAINNCDESKVDLTRLEEIRFYLKRGTP